MAESNAKTPTLVILFVIAASGVPVTVYQGQLDLICCTLGAESWMAKLQWPGMQRFLAAKRRPFYSDADGLAERQPRQTAGFVREHGPLALVTVMSAGESVCVAVWVQ